MLESSTLEEEKQDAFRCMLRTGRILVWVNMLDEALVVPHALRITPLSPLAYTPAVRPHATSEGIFALMWLGGRTFETFVPWTAVYFVGSKRGQMSWLQHAPVDLSVDDLESICVELDAEYDDTIVGCELDAGASVGTVSGAGVPASDLVAAAQLRSDAGDVIEPEPAATASSTATTVPRASSPSLTVILGGGGDQDSDD